LERVPRHRDSGLEYQHEVLKIVGRYIEISGYEFSNDDVLGVQAGVQRCGHGCGNMFGLVDEAFEVLCIGAFRAAELGV